MPGLWGPPLSPFPWATHMGLLTVLGAHNPEGWGRGCDETQPCLSEEQGSSEEGEGRAQDHSEFVRMTNIAIRLSEMGELDREGLGSTESEELARFPHVSWTASWRCPLVNKAGPEIEIGEASVWGW